MALAFWRRTGRRAKTARGARTQEEPADLRIRARRRLIGAAALLLTAAIVVPMVLDPVPRPSNDDIALDIPSEKTPFTPRLALPPVPSADNVPVAPPPDTQEKSADAPVQAADAKKADEQRASALLEGKAAKPPAVTKNGKFVVQAAAPASEAAARNLSEKLRNAGLASYTEKVETKQGARYRVRLGPYASRDEADDVRTRLKAHGISANLVTL
jgi:DedD protein